MYIMYIYIYVYIYYIVYIYTHMCIYIHIYIHTSIHTSIHMLTLAYIVVWPPPGKKNRICHDWELKGFC